MTGYERKIVRELMKVYEIDEEDAEEAVREYGHLIDQGETLGHAAHSVAFKIAQELDLTEKDEEEE